MGGAETYRPAKLTPITDPRELREATVRDYRRNADLAGIQVSTQTLEMLAVHDLQVVEAFQKGVDVTRKPKPPKSAEQRQEEHRKRQEQSSILLAGDNGVRFKEAPPVTDRPEVLYKRAHKRGAKWSAAVARIRRILQGAGPGRTVRSVVSTAECPDLAEAFWRLDGNYRLRHRNSRHNPFFGLNENDAARMFEAEVYKICDRSTGRLRSWYTK